MKKIFRKIAAVMAAVSVIGTASMSVSATTADDVVAAARNAGFLEVYVQQLQNTLRGYRFSSDQYDIIIEHLYDCGEEMNKLALDIFDVPLEDMKEKKEEEAEKNGTDIDNSWLDEIVDKMDDDNIVTILDEMVEAGKEVGLDVTFEKKGDKEYILTVKDKDGNIQLVTPVGKLVDRTGISETDNDSSVTSTLSCVTAVGLAVSFYL